MSEQSDDQTFLVAVTLTGHTSRSAARAALYEAMGRTLLFTDMPLDSWWDAGPDHTDRNDNGEAVWCHPGRALFAQRLLVNAGLAPESDMALGPHPSPLAVQNDAGEVIVYECERCGNGAESPEVLAEVPCIDLSRWEHAHYWTTDDEDPIQRITCLSDCGMTIERGQAVGSVSAEAAGNPPE